MLDQTLRVPKRVVLMPVAKRLNISPSVFTALGLVTGLAAAVLIGFQQPIWGLALWLLNRVLDGLDGEIARAHGRQSDLGAYFDMMADLAIYAALPLALVLASPSFAAWLSLAALLSSFYINAGSWMYLASLLEKRGLGAKAKGESTSITMPSGIIEGTETIVFYTVFLIIPDQIVILFSLMTLLIGMTIMQRFIWASKKL
jgi:phosphatidylglycerophosphate synthase